MTSLILAAGLTPAWQQILVFDSLRVGGVNRAREAHWCASGKVLNAGLALHFLGAQSLALAVVGGPHEDMIDREFTSLGVPHRWIRSESPTRVCTTILDRSTGIHTELVQNAQPIRPEELEQFVCAYEEEVGQARLAILIGSLPGGVPTALYRSLMEKTRVPVILDASGPELLAALPIRPFCVKPNREELARTLGRTLNSDADLREAMAHVNSLGAEWIVVSQGEKPLWAGSRGRIFTFGTSKIEAVNPIGSGDCLAAGIAFGIAGGMDMLGAIRFGIAAAAENASMLLPARLDPERVKGLAARIPVEPL
ncbi:MAG TPA: PfkB family carbohydrate kinase [Acidobacteriota bacterium]|nr:PfkB family carbohydrate kinase [Acidobacteriota bacterium]